MWESEPSSDFHSTHQPILFLAGLMDEIALKVNDTYVSRNQLLTSLPIDLRRLSLPCHSGQHEPSCEGRWRLELANDSQRRFIRHEVNDRSYEGGLHEWPPLL